MAKKKKKKVKVVDNPAVMSNKDWEAENDARVLKDAAQIEKSPERNKKAKAHLHKQQTYISDALK